MNTRLRGGKHTPLGFVFWTPSKPATERRELILVSHSASKRRSHDSASENRTQSNFDSDLTNRGLH